MKEAVPSSLARYEFSPQPAWPSEAERVISAQRRMQNRCPALLSTTVFPGQILYHAGDAALQGQH